jgi:hypothetical protein
MKRILLFLVAITLVTGLTTCKKDADKIVGTWGRSVNGQDYTVTISDDGKLIISLGSTSISGTYSISGSVFTISDPSCGISGDYGFSVNKKTLKMMTILDKCDDRNDVIAGDWSKQ